MAATHRVVVIGSGFGGLFSTRALRKAPVEITLISRTVYHLFQPLLYQVATGILSEGEIAPATREVLRRQKNARVLLGDVTEIDLAAHTVTSTSTLGKSVTAYDSLIVAAGAGQSYFGHDEFAEYAPGLKSIDDALELRARIFGAFEVAELASDPDQISRLLTFCVIGAGPTGIEMAGQIAELARRALPGEYRNIDTTRARIILLDAAPVVLGSFDKRQSKQALKQLARIGVEVQLQMKVVGVDADGVDLEDANRTPHRIECATKVWAAGVSASPLGAQLAEQSGAELDRAGRVHVQPDLSLRGHPEVYVVGDMMALDDLPGLAQVAIQGGQHAADQILRRLRGEPAGQPFHYRDKGTMATVSRFQALASIGPLHLSGFIAWILWLVVHLIFLIGFKNRVTTLFHWAVTFVGRGRAERAGISPQRYARKV